MLHSHLGEVRAFGQSKKNKKMHVYPESEGHVELFMEYFTMC